MEFIREIFKIPGNRGFYCYLLLVIFKHSYHIYNYIPIIWGLCTCLLDFNTCKENFIYLCNLCCNCLPPEWTWYSWFCVYRVLLWFGQGYKKMVLNDYSASNAYLLLFSAYHTTICFGQACVSCTCPWIILW